MATYIVFIHIVFVAVIVTNIDNMVILLTFTALPIFKRYIVVLGYWIAVGLVLILTYLISGVASKLIPIHYLLNLGFIPIIIGVYKFAQLYYRKPGPAKTLNSNSSGSVLSQLTFNITTQLACSVDNVAVFVPLLLKHHGEIPDFIFGSVFLITALLLSLVVTWLSHFIKLTWLNRFAKYLVPFLLIFIGIYILYL